MTDLNKYVFYFFMLCQIQLLGQEQWNLVKDNEGIKVYTRINEVLSFKEFKANMTVKAKMTDFIAVLYDINGLSNWGHNITEARLLERPNDTVQIYYAVAKAPWPYKDRDGIYENIFSWDSSNRTLTVKIQLLEDDREQGNNFVRLDGYGYWMAREISSNQLEVDFQMQVDPGGSIKAWKANMFVTDSPFYTMQGIREAMGLKKYQGKTYGFLVE